jgi:hypothetical protein
MKQKLFKIAGDNTKTLRLFVFLILISFNSNAQTQSNLEIFYSLVDSASYQTADEVLKLVPEAALTTELGIYYTVFENQIFSGLSSRGLKLKRGAGITNDIPNLNFLIKNAEVKYGEQKRDWFLGDFIVTREVLLQGSYLLTSNEDASLTKMNEFSFSYSDRVKVEDIEKIENRSFPFTSGILPEEPFFSSILEPVIAVSAAAIAVILFFSVRSK